jgi:hypothetical protein
MSKTILQAAQNCVRDGWYIAEFSRQCRHEMQMNIKVGEKAPLCPKCGNAVNWILVERPTSHK